MKLYLIAGNYFGTQAEAKPAAAQAGIKASQIGDHEVDVPTDKAGLIDYLNKLAQGKALALLSAPNPLLQNLVFTEQTERAPQPAEPQSEEAKAASSFLVRAQHSIAVETEIARADFPNAIRLAEHANQRVAEHLRDIANEASAKPRGLSGILS